MLDEFCKIRQVKLLSASSTGEVVSPGLPRVVWIRIIQVNGGQFNSWSQWVIIHFYPRKISWPVHEDNFKWSRFIGFK